VLRLGEEAVPDAKRFHKLAAKSDLRFPLSIAALRDGRELEFELAESQRPRDLEVLVVGDGVNVNAFAHPRGIVVTTGMLNFLKNDSEVAVVMGHELAHIVKGHFSTSYREGYWQPYFSQDLEREADRWGLELAHRAGFNPEVGVAIWERMDAELPRNLGEQFFASHPSTPQRIATARRVAEELEAIPQAQGSGP